MRLNRQQNQQYVAMQKTWQKCRDAIAGQDAIKSRGMEYLPDLRSVDNFGVIDNVYKTKLALANYDNVPGSTLDKCISIAMRKPFVINTSDVTDDKDGSKHQKLREIKENKVNQCFRSIGRTVDSVTWMMREYLSVGRFAVLVKLPKGPNATPKNKAQEEQLKRMVNQDPFLLAFKAEMILDWRENISDNGYKFLEYVKLKVSENTIDQKALFYRKIDGSVETAEGTIYDDWDSTQESDGLFWLKITGIDTIPIVFCNGVDVQRPPMADLVDLAITHYQTASNLAYKQHATISDLLVIETDPNANNNQFNGRIDDKDCDQPKIAANESGAMVILPAGKTAKVLNSNAVFDSYETRLSNIRQSMSDAQAIILSLNENRSKETATAYESRLGVQTANVKFMIEQVQACLDAVFDIAGRWSGSSELIGNPLLLNTDLVYTGYASISDLISALSSGLISRESALLIMIEMDLLPEGISAEIELERLLKQEQEKIEQEQEAMASNIDKNHIK